MEQRQRVYRLTEISDDPRFEGFGGDIAILDAAVPKQRNTRRWTVRRVAATWQPVRAKGRVRRFNDFPCLVGRPAFSLRAVEALRDILEQNGELLPLISPSGTYFAYNLTTVADVLDVRRSEVEWLTRPFVAGWIDRYEFRSKELNGLTIFRLPEDAATVYVTQPFVTRVEQNGLQGFNFDLLWPLPKGVAWDDLSKESWHLRLQNGLPQGQSLKGNTVVIRLLLARDRATAEERRQVERIMDELDGMLIDQLDASSPLLGNLEGLDFGARGECRLFLSCPDADRLAMDIRPWLKAKRWPGGAVLTKRYGHYSDSTAREVALKV